MLAHRNPQGGTIQVSYNHEAGPQGAEVKCFGVVFRAPSVLRWLRNPRRLHGQSLPFAGTELDALDLLSTMSVIQRRLDGAVVLLRA
ncbi:MAG: hypothetical protein QG597_134 [Actinomycetota bacterium]|nr:hypothetical protein [Actinomycetota bacterium]